MKLHLLAMGERVPGWVNEACADYARRFPPHCRLQIQALAMPRRVGNPDIARLRDQEFGALSRRIAHGALVIALTERGHPWTSVELSRRLGVWMHAHADVAFLIGGPDGLAPQALETAHEQWSLSALTLPHALARVIVAEQLYRALCIRDDHPYHRA